MITFTTDQSDHYFTDLSLSLRKYWYYYYLFCPINIWNIHVYDEWPRQESNSHIWTPGVIFVWKASEMNNYFPDQLITSAPRELFDRQSFTQTSLINRNTERQLELVPWQHYSSRTIRASRYLPNWSPAAHTHTQYPSWSPLVVSLRWSRFSRGCCPPGLPVFASRSPWLPRRGQPLAQRGGSTGGAALPAADRPTDWASLRLQLFSWTAPSLLRPPG